jgi:two-component system chemotaxis sensor kinase CheA
MDAGKYERIFRQESDRYLQELDELLAKVEKDPVSRELWTEIHGKIHSIKGMAKALSFHRITDLSHSMESWCKSFQEAREPATAGDLKVLLKGVGLLAKLVSGPEHDAGAEQQEIYKSILDILKRGPGRTEENGIDVGMLSTVAESGPREIDTVRVKYSLVEELLALSREIIFLEKSVPPLAMGRGAAGLKAWMDEYRAMLKMLYFRMARLRLMSIGDLLDLFRKTVRDLARENGKEVGIKVVGDGIETDITLLERLREPLMHLLRNSIAHGIETPEARKKAGKRSQGLITIEARRERDSLYFVITDDGTGIHREAITEYLRKERGMSEGEIAAMPNEEFLETILSPGFSTASRTTDMAGRGIGMSVVAQVINDLGGKMTIHSDPGEGTTFVIRLPVSLTVMNGLSFRVGPYCLSIPTLDVCSIDLWEERARGVAPVLEPRRFLDEGQDEEKPTHLIRLKSRDRGTTGTAEGQEIGMLVDGVIGNKPMMVLPVGDLLGKAKLFSGVGVMENGDLTVLMDTEMFMRFRDETSDRP